MGSTARFEGRRFRGIDTMMKAAVGGRGEGVAFAGTEADAVAIIAPFVA